MPPLEMVPDTFASPPFLLRRRPVSGLRLRYLKLCQGFVGCVVNVVVFVLECKGERRDGRLRLFPEAAEQGGCPVTDRGMLVLECPCPEAQVIQGVPGIMAFKPTLPGQPSSFRSVP
jgi:hypothetical protein